VPTVCETELAAGLRGEGARVKQESASREAFSVCQSADAWELSSHGRGMRARGDGSSETFAREEMEDGREGEAAPLRELRVGGAWGEERIQGEIEASQEGAELLRRSRSAREASGSGRSQESGSHEKEWERGGGGLAASGRGRGGESFNHGIGGELLEELGIIVAHFCEKLSVRVGGEALLELIGNNP
jgi:hypothetical protein